mgnify:CR=1 FL=1
MPAHIYWRVGRYGDAVTVNVAAADADRAYFKTATPSPIYRGLYYPHNIDFIWQSAAMQGRSAETVRAAREFASNAPAEMIKQMPDMETAPVAPIVALVRFGRWDEVLAYPAPPSEWTYTSGVWRYARGMAFNGKGQADLAAGELRALEAILQSVPPERTVAFFFRAKNVLQLAANLLAGEIAAKAGDFRPPNGYCAPPSPSKTRTGSRSRRRGTSRCASRWGGAAPGRPAAARPSRSTARTFGEIRVTAGRCTGSRRACALKVRRPRPRRSTRAFGRRGRRPT